MGPDQYKVEVLHYLNPFLIWVEVVDPDVKRDEYIFEQVGIYGVLPLETTIDDDCQGLQTTICKDWTKAATLLMKELLHNAVEVYFAPTYIDRRTSIFDDNIHKYGELIIIHENDTEKSLSHCLVKQGLALQDECLFHQELLSGNLKTKLSLEKTNKVIFEIERNCLKKEKQKKSIRKQAKLVTMAQQVESSLTVRNVQMLNFLRDENNSVEEYLQKKIKDIENCRDIDDEPVGRGVSNPASVCSSRRSLLRTRLRLTEKSDNDCNILLQATKHVLDANAVKKTSEKLPSLTSESEMSIKIETSSINYDKNSNYYQKWTDSKNKVSPVTEDKPISSLKNLSRVKKFLQLSEKNIVVDNTKTCDENVSSENFKRTIKETVKESVSKIDEDVEFKHRSSERRDGFDKNMDREKNETCYFQCEEPSENVSKKASKIKRSPHKLPKYDATTHKSVAFGPPETNPTQLLVKIVPKKVIENEIRVEPAKEQIPLLKKEDAFENVDSHIDMTITNKEMIKELHKEALKKLVDTKKYGADKTESCIQESDKSAENTKYDKASCKTQKFSKDEHIKISKPTSAKDDSSSDDTKKHSSLLTKKLQLYKQTEARNTSTTSDTSTKDSSSSMEMDKPRECSKQHTELDSDDDNVTEILQKIDSEYPEIKPEMENEIMENTTAIKTNVNPFKNVDANISVFVEKLVTAILMVHTKSNKRIQPVSDLRDVPFNTHIDIVLKSMSIKTPMILQRVSWLSILRGYSTFLVSPPGSGKTMGYLPAVCRLVTDASIDMYSSGPLCIIVCATAKSVADIEKMSRIFLHQKDKVLACHPGMNELNLLTSILNGCDLLICTPSILVRLLKNNEFGVDLRRLTTFVLDDCERLSEVYSSEIKFFLLKIKEALKTRADQILKVQYILASRIWCNFMESLAKKAPNALVSIGAFQECVLYAKANMTAAFVAKENKVNSTFDFLNEIDLSKKTVIVCRTDDEVEILEKALKRTKHVVFACNSTMTVQDLHNISLAWNEYHDPTIGPILVCCDGNLFHLNVTDAHNLIHYSLPNLFSLFCKRFSVLNDNYASIFNESDQNVKIKVLIDDTNIEQLPKIIHFIKRCHAEVPQVLDEMCEKVLAQKDASKAASMIPICDNLLAFGECPDFWNCRERHAIFKDYDTPKQWMPKNGVVTFKIIHYHTATMYSARLLSYNINGETVKYPQIYTTLSMKISTYYAKESNKRLHGIPKVGEICAVALNQNLFVRGRVAKILTYYQNGNPNYVIVKLLDEEKYERTRDIYLYHLPDEMKNVETHVAIVRMANIQPRDKDVTFSELALNQLKHITDAKDDLYLRGEVSLTVGNCIFVNNLETCRDLSSMNETVVYHNFKQELEDYAVPKPDHLPNLEKICLESGLPVEKKIEVIKVPKKKQLPVARWAHLEKDDFSSVLFASAVDPGTFFVRLVKFNDCMDILLKDIQKHVAENPNMVTDVKKGDIVLAKNPDDEMYERARVDDIAAGKYKCFFVDQGDWLYLQKSDLSPITEKLITQMPFQAIECRLVGVEPCSEEWTEFSTNWFTNCFEDNSGNLKQLYVKYFTKEIPIHTGGHKYGVALVDTSTENDVIINKLIVEVNLATEDEQESEYLLNLYVDRKTKKSESSDDDDDDWEKVSVNHNKKEIIKQESNVSLDKIFLKQPIRSVPLVGSDDSDIDIDSIDFNMTNDFMGLFKPMTDTAKLNVPAIDETISPRSKIDNFDTLSDSDISIVKSIHSNDNYVVPSCNKEEFGTVDKLGNLNSDAKTLIENGSSEIYRKKLTIATKFQVKQQDKISGHQTKILNKTANVLKNKNLNNASLDSDDLTSPEKSKLSDITDKSSENSSSVSVTCKTRIKTDEQVKQSFDSHHNPEDVRIPKLCWRQTNTDVFIKIQIIGADEYNLEIKQKHLKFDTVIDDVKYAFDFELYGVVDVKTSKHANKGQYILVNLKKVLKKNWLLLNWGGPKKYIVYDVDHIEESSSDEEIIDERENFVKKLNVSESESDDDNFIDDLNYSYKRYID